MSLPPTPLRAGSRPRVVLVLSGGGAKTAAHLGVWRALAETDLRPAHVIAVSMGAVLAAALGSGARPDDVLAQLVRTGPGSLILEPSAFSLTGCALFQSDGLRRAIEMIAPARDFGALEFPLTVPVVDLDTGESLLYGAGGRDAPLVDVLCATCALPVYFPPVLLEGRRCGDGGLCGALPLEPAIGLPADLVVAVDVGPGTEAAVAGEQPAGVPPLLRAHDDAVSALMAAVTTAQLTRWRADARLPALLYIRPPVERYATFRIDRAEHYAAAGYQAARDALDSAS